MGNAVGFGVPMNASVEHETFCQRLGRAICGVFLGVALFFGTIILLGWNEFNFVHNEEILRYVLENTREAACTPNPSNHMYAVQVSCPLTTLWDFSEDSRLAALPKLFGTTGAASGALTTVWVGTSSEIFQWVEDKDCEKRSDGAGGTTTVCTYTYSQQWSGSAVDSKSFGCFQTSAVCVDPSGRRVNPTNVGSIPDLLQRKLYAPEGEVMVGTSYGLNTGLLSQLGSQTTLAPVLPSASVYLPGIVDGRSVVIPDGAGAVRFIVSMSPGATPQVGDVRTRFTKSALVQGSMLSAVAMQEPTGYQNIAALKPWDTGKQGTMSTVNWAYEGYLSLQSFLNQKASENNGTTWLLRLAGWLLMFIGLQLITGPIALMPEAVPCIGGIIGEVVGCALCCVNLGLSLTISMTVIAFAWILARPFFGLVLLAVAGALLTASVLATKRFKGSRPARQPPLMGADPFMAPSPAMMAQLPQTTGQTTTFPITVPPNTAPGMQLQVQAPDGRMVLVTVPQGVWAGQTFMAQVPPPQYA